MVTICSIGSGYAGGSCSRKKNDRRKETRFKFLMVNGGGGGNDGKRERESVYGREKKSVLQAVHNRNRETTCRVLPLYSSSGVYQSTCRGYFPSIHES